MMTPYNRSNKVGGSLLMLRVRIPAIVAQHYVIIFFGVLGQISIFLLLNE